MPLSLIILLQVFAVVQGLWQNSVCFEPWNCPLGYSNNFISWNEMGFFNYIFLLFSSILFFIFIFILKLKKNIIFILYFSHHEITEILLKVALNTITPTPPIVYSGWWTLLKKMYLYKGTYSLIMLSVYTAKQQLFNLGLKIVK